MRLRFVDQLRVRCDRRADRSAGVPDIRSRFSSSILANIVVIYRKIAQPTIDAPLAGAIVRRKGFPIVHEPHRNHDRDATIYPVVDKCGVLWRATPSGNQRMFMTDRVI